ncbi:single-stranded DNA-binding protein [Cellulomonas soli]|uniref:Single-stranded DNA-binding protein n=1 Tax=Cellulomonas soli TaxID=931535 RepID=A0A512PB02_9CELL|nr:single-stranded DNA-binding protein [Cellulomonas soli]NYI57330.1 single-strand DNA-binding protein [Cellulomonas soli]GEP68390.1 hypothetical protein CSO01_11050 [Cellulomonas soli]
MSTHSLDLTLVGWIATPVRHYPGTDGGTPYTSFRMASTRRWFDRESGLWKDGRTEWFTVKAFRGTALNAATSLRKGDPVLVHGRIATEDWTGADGPRTTLVIEAAAIGHDLTYGSAQFMRTVHTGGQGDAAGEQTAAIEPGDEQEPGLDPVDVSALMALDDVDLVGTLVAVEEEERDLALAR